MLAKSFRRSASRSSIEHWIVAYADADNLRLRFHILNSGLSFSGARTGEEG